MNIKRNWLAFALLLSTLPLQAKDLSTGQKAPSFSLPDSTGKTESLSDYKGKYVVLEWINHGCPFIKKHYNSGNMQALQKEYTGKGVVWLSICSSAKGKEGYLEAEEWNKITMEKGAAPTAVLLDPAGKVGKAYGAKATPHMFVIGPDGRLLYQGAIDDTASTDPDDIKTSKNYVRAALDEAMAGKPVTVSSTKAYGCGVKYK